MNRHEVLKRHIVSTRKTAFARVKEWMQPHDRIASQDLLALNF